MIHIFGGGTVSPVRAHLSLCATAYGETALQLRDLLVDLGAPAFVQLTRMADRNSRMETNADVSARLDLILADPHTMAIIFNAALCDFHGQIGEVVSGKYAQRLHSREGDLNMTLSPADKLLARIKVTRPDITLVGFKTTCNAHADEQFLLAQRQVIESSADFVVANDTGTRCNMLIQACAAHTEAFVISESFGRAQVLLQLAQTLAARFA